MEVTKTEGPGHGSVRREAGEMAGPTEDTGQNQRGKTCLSKPLKGRTSTVRGLFHIRDKTISPTGEGDDSAEQGELQTLQPSEEATGREPATRTPQKGGPHCLVESADACPLWDRSAGEQIATSPVVLLTSSNAMLNRNFRTPRIREKDPTALHTVHTVEPPGRPRSVQTRQSKVEVARQELPSLSVSEEV